MSENGFDRTAQDVGNILSMEHVNVTFPTSNWRRPSMPQAWA